MQADGKSKNKTQNSSRDVSLTVFIPEPSNKRLLTRDRVEDKPEDVAIKKPAVLLQRVGGFKTLTGLTPASDQKEWVSMTRRLSNPLLEDIVPEAELVP